MEFVIAIFIALVVIILAGVGIHFFTYLPPQIIPSKVTNISLVVRSNQWFITWAKPTTGSDTIGYIYLIQGISVPENIGEGTTLDLTLALDKSRYTPSDEYLITIIPKNPAGDGPDESFLFTAPIFV